MADKGTEKPIEVEAEPIERGIVPMGALDALVAEIADEAARLASEYQPREITGEDGYKQSKRERAGARKDIAALKARYDDSIRAIKDAVREADARTKAALAPLDEIDDGYKAEVTAYEERWRLERRALLAQEYADMAPDLVELVPFDRLMDRHGRERGKQWDARSMTDGQAVAAMQQAVARIAEDERTITEGPWDEEDRTALKADYFRTLDLSGALRRTQEAKDQRERVERLERERRQREEEAAAEMERLRAERDRREAEARAEAVARQDPPQAPDIIKTVTSMTPEEYEAELEALGTPMASTARPREEQRRGLVQEVASRAGAPQPGEAVPTHVFAGYGNQAQADAFVDFCNRAGVRRRTVVLTHGKSYRLTTKGE